MKRFTFLAAAAVTLGSLSGAWAANQADQHFITEAIQGDMAEVQMGQLAQQKGQSDAVKSYGQMLVNDHQADEQKAKQVANQIGVTPPNEPTAAQKSDYDKMSKLSGKAFDRRFAVMMVNDHRKDIKKFQREARKSNDPVGQYANEALPTLKKHLSEAQKLEHNSTASR